MAEAELEENLDRTFKSILRAHDEVRGAGGRVGVGRGAAVVRGRWTASLQGGGEGLECPGTSPLAAFPPTVEVSGIGTLAPPVTVRGEVTKALKLK